MNAAKIRLKCPTNRQAILYLINDDNICTKHIMKINVVDFTKAFRQKYAYGQNSLYIFMFANVTLQ